MSPKLSQTAFRYADWSVSRSWRQKLDFHIFRFSRRSDINSPSLSPLTKGVRVAMDTTLLRLQIGDYYMFLGWLRASARLLSWFNSTEAPDKLATRIPSSERNSQLC